MKKKSITILLVLLVPIIAIVLYVYYDHSLYEIKYINPEGYPRSGMPNSDEKVSVISLISNPNKYNGKRIQVVGVANLGFEDNHLYLSKEDFKHRITKNSLWIALPADFPKEEYEKLKKLNGKYVEIEGFFDTTRGHFGSASGTVMDIQRYERTIW